MKGNSLSAIHFSLLICAIFFVSCAEKPPIPEEKFSGLYVALHLLDAQYASHPTVEKAKADSILRAYDVSDSLLNAEISWYSRNPERWQAFFAAVQSKMKVSKGAFQKQHP